MEIQIILMTRDLSKKKHKILAEVNVHKDLKKTNLVTVVCLFVLKEQQKILVVIAERNDQKDSHKMNLEIANAHKVKNMIPFLVNVFPVNVHLSNI